MYCTRPATRSPQAIRIVSRAPAARRQASYYQYPIIPSANLISPFFSRQAAPIDPFRSFERLVDDVMSTAFTPPQHLQFIRGQQQQPQPEKPFSPRFDIRENGDSYELRGEIPGVEAKDLEVQFSDAQTLVIKGRTESQQQSSSDAPSAAAQAEATPSVKGKEHEAAITDDTAAAETSDAASVHSTGSGSHKKPSVEDESEGFENIESAEAKEIDTPASTPGAEQNVAAQSSNTEAQPEKPQQEIEQAQRQAQQEQGYYFVSERSTGSFQRVFKFQHRIEQEGVTANLKNGILSIVVPKKQAQEVRRIAVL